jgi:hypothetical protein
MLPRGGGDDNDDDNANVDNHANANGSADQTHGSDPNRRSFIVALILYLITSFWRLKSIQ